MIGFTPGPFEPPIMVLEPEHLKTLWLIGGAYKKGRTAFAREITRRIRIVLDCHMIATQLETHIYRNHLRVLWLGSKAND